MESEGGGADCVGLNKLPSCAAEEGAVRGFGSGEGTGGRPPSVSYAAEGGKKVRRIGEGAERVCPLRRAECGRFGVRYGGEAGGRSCGFGD